MYRVSEVLLEVLYGRVEYRCRVVGGVNIECALVYIGGMVMGVHG